MGGTRVRAVLLTLLSLQALAAQRLTLQQAIEMALRNHPQLQASRFLEEARRREPDVVRARQHPFISGAVTGAMSLDNNSRILAGGLNNPIVYNRLGSGLIGSQLITDFGRTRSLVASAESRVKAQEQTTTLTRAEVLLAVNRAYFAALRAEAVERVAEQTVAARRLVADQAAGLAKAKLKSELDVSFARVNLEEAQLLLNDAQNQAKSAMTELSNTLGLSDTQEFDLAEEPVPGNLPTDSAPLIAEALQRRPELLRARLEQQAAADFARAERSLRFPTVTAIATLGVSPAHIDRLSGRWASAGVNIELPFLNGGLLEARRGEAESREIAAGHAARDVANRVARDVRLAYLAALNAFQRLGLTAQLLDQAQLSLKLAQSRYDLGLSSIVELSQAQLNVTRAQIAQASARFDYQAQRAFLDFQTGSLR